MTLKSNGFHRLKTAIPPAVVCDFEKFSREKAFAEKRIQFKITKLKKTGWWDWYFKELLRESQTTPTKAYPSQGLIQTLYDFPEYESPTVVKKISSRLINQTVREWLYYLELFNHPARIKCLQAKTAEEFQPPKNKW